MASSDEYLPVVKVSPEKLQDLFNNSQYPELIRTRILRELDKKAKHIKNLEALNEKDLPYCTNSEYVTWGD